MLKQCRQKAFVGLAVMGSVLILGPIPRALCDDSSKAREASLSALVRDLPVKEVSIANADLQRDPWGSGESEMVGDSAFISITLGVASLDAQWTDDGDVVLTDLREIVVTEDDELVELVFNDPSDPGATRGACAMKIEILPGGHSHVICVGDCPAGEQCTMKTHWEARGRDGGLKKVITCRCEKEEPIPPARESARGEGKDAPGDGAVSLTLDGAGLELYPNDRGLLALRGAKAVILRAGGKLDRFLFDSEVTDRGRASACGVLVIIEEGKTTITCEGDCPPNKPHCRMTIEETVRDGGEEPKPTKYKVFCNCGAS